MEKRDTLSFLSHLIFQNILNFMVGDKASSLVKNEVLQVLQHAGLMSNDVPSFISTLGFQFLLMSRPSQVWYFVMQYLKSAQVSAILLILNMLCINHYNCMSSSHICSCSLVFKC